MPIELIAGTRPELVKIAPIAKKLKRSKYRLVFTGQHYDYNMSVQFMEELDIKADVSKALVAQGPVAQVAEMAAFLASSAFTPDSEYGVVVGDTNSAFAGAFAALKSGVIPVHVEAGLRSNDWRMAEEHNRIMCDHISELLCAPTYNNKKTLEDERVHGRVFVTGNTVIDAVEQNLPRGLKRFAMDVPDDFVLVTLHRAENVDDRRMLATIVKSLESIKREIVFPVHPRTRKRLAEFGLLDRLACAARLVDPVGYFDFLALMKKCSLVITDSGGVQEECTVPAISKYVVVLRKSTERTESVSRGYSVLPALDRASIVATVRKKLDEGQPRIRVSPYGDGDAGGRIARILLAR